MKEELGPKFGNKKTGCCNTIMPSLTLPFSPGNFVTKNNMAVVCHRPYFSLFIRLKIKFKGHHFDTTEMIEAESQAVLNTFTKQDFEDAFKNSRSSGNGAYARKETT
jgi:hypothetical protein